MFENVGEKIKSIAKFVCWGGIAADITLAIMMFIAAEEGYSSTETMYTTIGLVFLIVGPVVSWISSLLLYAFGEINVSLMSMSKKEQDYNLQKSERENKLNTLKKWKELGIISEDEFKEKSKTVK